MTAGAAACAARTGAAGTGAAWTGAAGSWPAGGGDRDWTALREALPPANRRAAAACAVRLHDALPDQVRLDRNVVLVAYGGGKDSSYLLAFVRAVQLILRQVHGSTFRLRVATNRHAGMPRAVLMNIDRAYRALRLYQDPACELLLLDGSRVRPFDLNAPQPAWLVARNRLDMLMAGHRTAGDGRPTFCNACNLSMVNSFGLAAGYRGGVDVIVTGDSRAEQRAYLLWVRRLARGLGRGPHRTAAADRTAGTGQPARGGFGDVLDAADRIAGAYFGELYGGDRDRLAERRVCRQVPGRLRFFSIYDDTHYCSADHWELLTDFLGFEFDDIAFSFTESDCGNPALMAHLRGLKCERVYGRTYQEGLAEYTAFGLELMARKEFPVHLVEVIRRRYTGSGAAERMRAVAGAYAREAFGLTEEQLVCMVHAPFVGKGERLAGYLAAERPDLAGRVTELHELLGSAGAPRGPLTAELEAATGLRLDDLRTLYRSSGPAAPGEQPDIFGRILAGDPHKAVIATRHAPGGPLVSETLSGR
jgi:hypothetical protein